MKVTESNVGLVAAALYTGLSLVAGLVFLAITLAGEYDWVARLGGAAWVFGLTMVILMPTVTPLLRSWMTGEKAEFKGHDHDAMLREEAARSAEHSGHG